MGLDTILLVIAFILYINKDAIVKLFTKKVDKDEVQVSYDLHTNLSCVSDEISEHFILSNLIVGYENRNRHDLVINNTKIYLNTVNIGIDGVTQNEVTKLELVLPQNRQNKIKFFDNFKLYINEEISFVYVLTGKRILDSLKEINYKEDNFTYFTVETKLSDGSISFSNKLPLQEVIKNTKKIGNFDLERSREVFLKMEEKEMFKNGRK